MGNEYVKDRYYSYKKYISSIISVYTDERLEVYYYPILKKFLSTICFCDAKVVSVFDNKKVDGVHANRKSIYTNEGGLQDIIIVPNSYTYEKPEKPFITVEAKRPDIDIKDGIIKRYNKLKVKNNKSQLYEQFQKINYIIFTDFITWYLLKYENRDILIEKEISLIIPLKEDWCWKSETHNVNEADNELNNWKGLIIALKEFIKKAIEFN